MRRRRGAPITTRREFLRTGLGGTAAACVTAACGDRVLGQNDGPLRVRENVKNISAARRDELLDAFLLLKELRSPFEPSLSYYDQFVRFHQDSVLTARLNYGYSISHQCPTFLPWHRKILMLFENAVRTHIREDFALPYWDWTDSSSLDVIFTDDFLGPYLGDEDDNYSLSTSRLAKSEFSVNLTASQLTVDGTDVASNCPFTYIVRGPKSVDLPTSADVAACLQVETYDSSPYDLDADNDESFRNYLLGISPFQLHSVPHVWLGGQWDADISDGLFNSTSSTFVGTMSALDCSPNDPAFFIHHCNVDRIWAIWETLYGPQYEPTSGWNTGWNRDDEMYPYSKYRNNPDMTWEGLTNGSMVGFESLGYTYDDLNAPTG